MDRLALLAPLVTAVLETWRDYAGGFLRALAIEDNVMLVIMIVLILLSTMNIISGLIMLVKNKVVILEFCGPWA